MPSDPLNIILKNKSGVRLNPRSIATQVDMNNVSGTASNVSAEIIALRTRIDNLEGVADAMHFKGLVNSSSPLPTTGVNLGDTYKVSEAGTFAGEVCEIGDMVVCVATNPIAWSVIQNNIDGAVTGPVSAIGGNLPSFNGTTGKIVQDSGLATTDVSSAVSLKHSHDNKSTLDLITSSVKTGYDTASSFVSGLDSTVTQAALKQAVEDDHTHSNKSTLDAITSAVKTGYDTASTFVAGLDASVTAAALKQAIDDDHTHDNKATLDAITSSVKSGYDTAVTEASKLDAVIISAGGSIPSTLRDDGIVFELEA